MYFRNILVPYDESEHAKSALHIALGLAGPYPEARVSVLTAARGRRNRHPLCHRGPGDLRAAHGLRRQERLRGRPGDRRPVA